jgi:hypothetical protein
MNHLAMYCDEYSYQWLELRNTIPSLEGMGWLKYREENVGRILKSATESTNEQAKEETNTLISLLGRLGGFRWKKYLPTE